MDDALTWLVPVATLVAGYFLRGLESRRDRFQSWDAAKREVYGRYLVKLEEYRRTKMELSAVKSQRDNALDNLQYVATEDQDITRTGLSQRYDSRISELGHKSRDLARALSGLEAEMEILSPHMVLVSGSITRRLVELDPGHDDWWTYKRRFIDRARLDLGLDRAPSRLKRLRNRWSKISWWRPDQEVDSETEGEEE